MKCSGNHLLTPVYLKLDDAMPWPEGERAFYLVTSTGLFLCRNMDFFRSCVPVTDFPSELAEQKPMLELRHPLIPRELMEQAVGFFDLVAQRHASEAVVLVVWNRISHAVELVVPEQVGIVSLGYYGGAYPISVEYQLPTLPPELRLLGDIHSHVDGPAYTSYTDETDETHGPGLHLVVGHIQEEPPDFYCAITVDGVRFRVRNLNLVREGYHCRRSDEVPQSWLDKVTVRPWRWKGYSGSDNWTKPNGTPDRNSDVEPAAPSGPGYTSHSPVKPWAYNSELEAAALPPGTHAGAAPNPIPPEPAAGEVPKTTRAAQSQKPNAHEIPTPPDSASPA
jgi:hypothetical protein